MILTKKYRLKNDKECIVRPAIIEDAAAQINLIQDILSHSRYVLREVSEFQPTLEEQQTFIHNMKTKEGWVNFVAELDGQLVGNLDFQNGLRRRNQHQGEFGIGIHHDFQGLGVGKAMMHSFIDWARENPLIEKLRLRVSEPNQKAIHLYKELGFKEEGREYRSMKLPSGVFVTAIEMYLFV